jgi:hypothetical protein
VDVKIAAETGLAPLRPDRRDQSPDPEPERPIPPAAVVELGRTPESPGTYNARGMLDRPTPAARPAEAAAPMPAPSTERTEPPPMTTALPENLRMPANAQVQMLSNSSPQVAAAMRQRQPVQVPDLQHLPEAMLRGIQTLAPSALKQAERHDDVAEHEDDLDPARQDDEGQQQAPARSSGGQRRA